SWAASYNQEALFYLWRRAPQSPAYNTKFVVHIESLLDGVALRKAWNAIVRRQSVLRTTYELTEKGVVQRVDPDAQCDFEEISSIGWSSEQLDAAMDTICREPFDLTKGPILKVRLFSTAPGEHFLLLCAHHVAIDYWSASVLLDEMRAEYAAALSGKPRHANE